MILSQFRKIVQIGTKSIRAVGRSGQREKTPQPRHQRQVAGAMGHPPEEAKPWPEEGTLLQYDGSFGSRHIFLVAELLSLGDEIGNNPDRSARNHHVPRPILVSRFLHNDSVLTRREIYCRRRVPHKVSIHLDVAVRHTCVYRDCGL